jgi:hypothetical protein
LTLGSSHCYSCSADELIAVFTGGEDASEPAATRDHRGFDPPMKQGAKRYRKRQPDRKRADVPVPAGPRRDESFADA